MNDNRQGNIPIIDLEPVRSGAAGALEDTAIQLRAVCERIGFLVLVGHGVPKDLLDRTFEAARRFHALPLETKLKLPPDAVTCSYVPRRASTTRASALAEGVKPNENEILFIRRRHDHAERPDEWPDLPGFRQTALAYYDAMQGLAAQLLPLYARALGLPANWFDGRFDSPLSALRLNYYPPHDYAEGQYGIAPHTDSTFITLLAQDGTPGLMVRTPEGAWIEVEAPPYSLVVNTGDLLHRWSNGRFLSTPHYASNRPGQARHSIPYTLHPDAEVLIECLPTCLGLDGIPRFEPVTAGDYLARYRRQNYDHLRQGEAVGGQSA